jgi:hypothetical protein
LGLEKIANYSNQFQKGELTALHTVQYNMLSGIQPHASRPGILWVGIHGSGIALMDGSTGLIEKSWFRVSPVRNGKWLDKYTISINENQIFSNERQSEVARYCNNSLF